MGELKPEKYDGPREGFDYVKYDGKFWRKQVRQSRIYHKGVFLGLRRFFWELIFSGDWKDIKIRPDLLPIQTQKIQDGNFVINGVNTTDVIYSLKSLTGLPIAELERRMLPDDRPFDEIKKYEYFGSNSDFGGFIRPGESLLEILAKDNDFVLGEGLTHQQVAKPMLQIFNAWLINSGSRYLHFELNGKEYLSRLDGFPMFQDSPFNDGIDAPGFNIEVENLKTNEKFIYAPLCPFLIHRYGFYEGDVPFRVDPKKAIEFFL